MWAILGAPAVPVSVHLFARVHVATLRTTRLGEFDFRFRSVQARGPSTLQSGVLYEVGRVTGQGTPAASSQQLDELCRGTRPWPASRALVPAGKGTGRRLEDPAVQHGKQRPAQAKDSPEIAGAPAFHLPKRIGRLMQKTFGILLIERTDAYIIYEARSTFTISSKNSQEGV